MKPMKKDPVHLEVKARLADPSSGRGTIDDGLWDRLTTEIMNLCSEERFRYLDCEVSFVNRPV